VRIAMVAPLEMRVPPVAYGGTELVVSLLTEELVRRGHDVTLFASGDSVTAATLVPGSPRFLRGSGLDAGIYSMLNVMACFERASEFDVIHNHTCFEGLATAGLIKTPVLTTLHGNLEGDWRVLFQRYKGWYNTISRSAARLLPPQGRFAGVIYNAIDVDSYPFNPGPRGDHLLYLSRISAEKGPHLAIEVARRLGRRLIIAGNVHPVDEPYFRAKVLPEVDGRDVLYVGEADYPTKRRLFAEASCLLAPITWDEPFGLFMVEAMACGTPVVAIGRGSVPEVVDHGRTGFVVDGPEAMAEAVGRVHEISPHDCRSHVASRFNVARMTDDYLSVYRRIVAAEELQRQTGVPAGEPPRDGPSPAGALQAHPAPQASPLRVKLN